MLPSCKSCVLVAVVVVLAVLVGYAVWVGGREAFANEDCPGLSFISEQVLRKQGKHILTRDEFMSEGLQQIRKVLNKLPPHNQCALSAHYEPKKRSTGIVSKVITKETPPSELKAFLLDAYNESSDVNFNACLKGSRFKGTGSVAQCEREGSSNVIPGGSQGCNQHENDPDCLSDDRCVLYRQNGGSGKTICYPKCPTIKNATDCNDNSQSFCAYKNGKCGYKCSEFNAKSTFDDSPSPNACAMASGCKVEGDRCVSTDTRASKPTKKRREYDTSIALDDDGASDTDAAETKQATAELVVENDSASPVFEVLGAEDEPVGKLPKCYTDYEKASPSKMAKGGEGAFLCKDKGVCMDNQMVGVLGGFLDLKGEALVGEINRRCGNHGVPVME